MDESVEGGSSSRVALGTRTITGAEGTAAEATAEQTGQR